MNHPIWYDEDAPLDEVVEEKPVEVDVAKPLRPYFLAAKAQGATDAAAFAYAIEMADAVGF